MVRTRITLDVDVDSIDNAHELVQMLRLGYHGELGQHRFEVAHASHIIEPDLPEEE